jgi:hypothetical protein
VGTGSDFLFFRARSYLAEFSAKTRNHTRLASATVNVFWFELNLALIRPVSGYLLFPFNVFRLSRFKRFTLVAVQSTIGNHFRHYSVASLFNNITFWMIVTSEISILQSYDSGSTFDLAAHRGWFGGKVLSNQLGEEANNIDVLCITEGT